MALRPAPKRKTVDYQKLDELQKEIFGSEKEKNQEFLEDEPKAGNMIAGQKNSDEKARRGTPARADSPEPKARIKPAKTETEDKKKPVSKIVDFSETSEVKPGDADGESPGARLTDLETIAALIVSSKAGQGRNTTRPFSLPRTLIIDTTRLKSKFRTIDEQFTQNVIIDFLLREALAAVNPENYKDLRAAAFEYVKRADETTRRSVTVTEEVIYQMSELKAGINLETGRKYSNDEIFSTLLAVGVSWLNRNKILN